MFKEDLISLLEIVERKCTHGNKESFYEQDRKKWGEYQQVIHKFINELKNGTFK